MLRPRFDGETDEHFRRRAKRAAMIAKVLIEAALNNHDVRRLIADPATLTGSKTSATALPFALNTTKRLPLATWAAAWQPRDPSTGATVLTCCR
jgi:hypothetical protein